MPLASSQVAGLGGPVPQLGKWTLQKVSGRPYAVPVDKAGNAGSRGGGQPMGSHCLPAKPWGNVTPTEKHEAQGGARKHGQEPASLQPSRAQRSGERGEPQFLSRPSHVRRAIGGMKREGHIRPGLAPDPAITCSAPCHCARGLMCVCSRGSPHSPVTL